MCFAAGLLVLVSAAGIAADRLETATAFAIAHLLHLVADLPVRLALGYPFGPESLFWPVVSEPVFIRTAVVSYRRSPTRLGDRR